MTTVCGCEMFGADFWSGCGICAVSPCSLSIDTTTMKTIISVSSTSISGVTLISGPRAPRPAIENDIERSSLERACLQRQTPGGAREFPAAVDSTKTWEDILDHVTHVLPRYPHVPCRFLCLRTRPCSPRAR